MRDTVLVHCVRCNVCEVCCLWGTMCVVHYMRDIVLGDTVCEGHCVGYICCVRYIECGGTVCVVYAVCEIHGVGYTKWGTL